MAKRKKGQQSSRPTQTTVTFTRDQAVELLKLADCWHADCWGREQLACHLNEIVFHKVPLPGQVAMNLFHEWFDKNPTVDAQCRRACQNQDLFGIPPVVEITGDCPPNFDTKSFEADAQPALNAMADLLIKWAAVQNKSERLVQADYGAILSLRHITLAMLHEVEDVAAKKLGWINYREQEQEKSDDK